MACGNGIEKAGCGRIRHALMEAMQRKCPETACERRLGAAASTSMRMHEGDLHAQT